MLATFTDKNLPKVATVVDGKVVMVDAPVDAKVLGGVVMGIVVALLYQRFYRTKLPDWAGFFGGRRLVPILSAFAGLVIGIVFGYIWPVLGTGLHNFGEWLVKSGAVGAGIFGVANRALIPIGMHHLLNSFPWFQAGEYHGKSGDIARFLAGDPQAGQFMTGFFPIMMFALPAACLAIVHCARPERRKVVGGMMFSLALTSFVTGVTEPIEFTFMFIAPVLYAIHAVLTGVSMALTWALGMKGRLRLLGGRGRLRTQPGHREQSVGPGPGRPVLRGGLLRDLPLRDHQVQPADAGPRGPTRNWRNCRRPSRSSPAQRRPRNRTGSGAFAHAWASDLVRDPRRRQFHRAAVHRAGVAQIHLRIGPRRDVGEDQAARPRARGRLPPPPAR